MLILLVFTFQQPSDSEEDDTEQMDTKAGLLLYSTSDELYYMYSIIYAIYYYMCYVLCVLY